jgi:hypothetical protein
MLVDLLDPSDEFLLSNFGVNMSRKRQGSDGRMKKIHNRK